MQKVFPAGVGRDGGGRDVEMGNGLLKSQAPEKHAVFSRLL